MLNKIFDLDKSEEVLTPLRKEGKKIVHCHGVFDLIHPGHIKHLEAAKKFGDVLVVTITEDKLVNKGPGRPVFNEILRAETLAALQVVDFVAISRNQLATVAIEAIKPDFYVKGQEYKVDEDDITGGIVPERNKVEEFGGKLVFTEEIVFSSTNIINRHLDFADETVKDYLKRIRELTNFDKIYKDFERIANYKVVVIGDIILDEYTTVIPLGKASKSSTITAKRLDSELYAGGVLAVANHISNFVKEVKLITTIGNNYGKDYTNFIQSKLNKNIKLSKVYTDDRPTVLKQRYVDRAFKGKLFEIIDIEDIPLPDETRNQIIAELHGIENEYDLVVVADFGHGMIDNEIVNYLCAKDIFLAVNTQTNSANTGFNLLTKYPRCNYFSIDENEAQLATHDKYSDIDVIFNKLLHRSSAAIAAITLGIRGAMVGSLHNKRGVKAPVLSSEVIDTIGAGDAFLSITSLMAKNQNTPDEIAFVGNAVGAMAVKILGNKSYIEKIPLMKYVRTLLT